MAWHILRKDLILLWPLAALSVLVQFGLDGLMVMADRTPDFQFVLLLIARLSVFVVFLTIVLAIALGAHQEPIPGTRQDWLVRPIRRGDLLLGKLLFVLMVVHLPMLLGDVGEALVQGFPLGPALAAAVLRNLEVLVSISLPALAFAAMTRTTAQFVGVGVLYFVGISAATLLLSSLARLHGAEQATNPLAWTGIAWISQALARAALALGSVVALLLLYLRRKVLLARSVFPPFAVASVLMVLVPWSWLFALQQAASAAPVGVQVRFDPQATRYRPPAGQSSDDYALGAAQVQLRGRAAGDIQVEDQVRRAQQDVTVFLPVRFDDLPAGAIPWADRAEVTLRGPDGRAVFSGRGDDLERANGRAYEAVRLPALVYDRLKDQPLMLQIVYSLSVLAPHAPVSIAALDADASLSGFGHCATGRDSDGDDVELRCLEAGRAPSCVSAALEDPASGRRNPDALICAPDYAPYASRPFPDALSRFQVEAPFRDRLGLARYPVDGAALSRAQLVLTRYDAASHVVRRVTAAQVRLADWTAARP